MSKGKNGQDAQGFIPVVAAHGQGGAEIMRDKSPTLNCNHEAPILLMPEGDLYKCGECAHSVNLKEHATTCPNCGSDTLENVMIEPSIGPNAGKRFDFGAQCYVEKNGLVPDVAPTLDQRSGRSGENSFATSGGLVPEIAEPMTLAVRGRGDHRELETRQDGTANAILTPNGGRDGMGVGAVAQRMAVRRLTARECERLQGFPDDFTLIPYNGKPAADGPRYKALGNSMAVPVVRWIGERIAMVDKL